ncbi:ATP-dependent Clp protease ATP-binding subunit (plasmid) [Lactobacillus johnsonii]|uniref:ATP-dependent Clp protease ATP-binding subunit n=2 Tax=Lactobacillus johnsonii TaxID=33959 RepID=A0A9X7XUW1_LACJH|nr:ATP-dependent Clp protease ATP-binding subunit [Lactobacillus johnsonii]
MTTDKLNVKLVLPKDIDEKYNHSLTYMKAGDGTLVGNTEKIHMLEDIMYNPGNPSAVLLGEAGIGKTALVEHLIYLHQNTTEPFIVVRLAIETLGELKENIVIARMSTLLDDMRKIKQATKEGNPGKRFKLILFIDEVHKLNDIGKSVRSSAALNALKEGLGRGIFPIITATTSKEYFENLATDEAIDRRFNQVILEPPSLENTKKILEKYIEFRKETNDYEPEISEESLEELISLTDLYIRNQVNPAKSIKILDQCAGHETRIHYSENRNTKIDHGTFQYVFKQNGFNIDPPASAKAVKEEVHRRVKGQPLAVKLIGDAINNAFFAPRNRKKPLLTAMFVGTTGTGKTETAKALAHALFGRDDAILTINGGDYPTPEDAPLVQKFIGDDMAANKQKVILLDEFEKAHKTVQFSLMRMLDEGIVRDSHGVERAINNTVVIATTNLGATFFNDLGKNMKLGRNQTPDDYSNELYGAFLDRKQDLIQQLVVGDEGQNNGIKPEILQRFQAIIPYLPLPKAIFALIARIKLLALKEKWSRPGAIYSLGDTSIRILLPKVQDAKWWEERVHNNDYAGIDPISATIAEDMINAKADQEGARAVEEIVNTRIVSKITNIISERIDAGLPVGSADGAFLIGTNGHAFFEEVSQERSDITVSFKPNNELDFMNLHTRKEVKM